MKYKRILLKLSGEALMGNHQHGIDPARLKEYAIEIKQVVAQGAEIAVVIGGGNIFRGVAGASNGMDRVQGDYMGMLATVINSLALQSALEDEGVLTRLQTAITMGLSLSHLSAVEQYAIWRKVVWLSLGLVQEILTLLLIRQQYSVP